MSFPSFRKLMLAAALAVPAALLPAMQAHAMPVVISVAFGPPALPVYVQPVCPGDGYMWVPGYWAWDDADGYYWVPGTWVMAPEPGLLWTPGYWGWGGSAFIWHAGYWGPHVGFYGGINYGFGYNGVGFEGGYWNGGHFFYNSAVVRFGGGWHPEHVYSRPVVVVNHTTIAYNGGRGGLTARASGAEMAAEREHHFGPTAMQEQHRDFARQDRSQFAKVNNGRPGVPAAATPGAFRAHPDNPGMAARPNQRMGNQQQRIANGVDSGRMTAGEASRADQRQSNIDRQVHNDRQQNGGALTPQERQQVNREQNSASRQIYNENHNDNMQRPQQQQQMQQQRQQMQQREQPQQQRAPQSQPQQRPAPEPRPAPAPQSHQAPPQASHQNGGGGPEHHH